MRRAWYSIALAAALFMAAMMGGILSFETPEAQAQRQSSYAIYLSPGPQSDVSWGGYHVTIAGFSNSHAPGKSEKREAAKAWKKVHGHGAYSFSKKHRGKDYWAHDLGGGYGYGICFKSGELDRLTLALHNEKFDNQKQFDGVKNGKKCRWHVSLYAKNSDDAYNKFEKYLKNVPWKLYEVRYPGTDWSEIG